MSELDTLGRRKRPRTPKPVYDCECGDHVWCKATKGFVVLVSPEDRGAITARSWCAAVRGPCVYAQSRVNGTGVYLHRLILPETPEIDHKNHNGLDNRRPNIRPCSRQQNASNQRARRTKTTSRHKGVWRDSERRWVATITKNRERCVIGYFDSEAKAVAAYAKEARRLFGEFAHV